MKMFDEDGFWGMSQVGWLWYCLQGELDRTDEFDKLDVWLDSP